MDFIIHLEPAAEIAATALRGIAASPLRELAPDAAAAEEVPEPAKAGSVDELPFAPSTWADAVPLLGGSLVYGGVRFIAGLVRFVILALLVAVFGFAAWSADWTGSPVELISVVAAGFAADVTADAVTTTAGGLGEQS